MANPRLEVFTSRMMSEPNVSIHVTPRSSIAYIHLFPSSYRSTAKSPLNNLTNIMSNKELDPYTAKAERTDLSPQQKVDGLQNIVNTVKTGMLTTRSAGGDFHSRAMAPVPLERNQITLVFIANCVSPKCDEIQNDVHVNVSFYDTPSTNWASYAGKARISQDKDKIAKHWSPTTAAWFGDLGDGVHKGDQNDPRVAVIEVIPDEIRYWIATRGSVGRTVEVAVGAMSGRTAAPGELRTISKDEIQLLQGLTSK
ncbi:hypothetical protein GSI_01565 [Ganoderma sinense ZZ0214-1]|uniref:General stress protein FMN-binding split barrel domain-containing protein n=1 Tax=Ganoderma sinense ZZ0214-1 TaxID=1077348 RepID=A0A2G8SQ61_9APHY|nr:hypothetical protein GSI_01565 [Ganoderma sinense ZZ0214-1]